MSEESQRMTAHEILDLVKNSAREEVHRKPLGLAVSGLAAGMTMGLTALGVAAVVNLLGHGKPQELIAMLAYPLGFVAVIIGRAQLFTENTLYPVILVLDERRYVLRTLRLWVIVFFANVVGAAVFGLLAVRSAALTPELRQSLIDLGIQAARHSASHLFWSGVIGGWLIALVAWLVSASQWSIAQMVITYMVTFLVGAGHFAHCIAGSCEVLSAVAGGGVSVGEYVRWLSLATAGNIVGGITIVSLLNWGQVAAEGE